MHNYGDLFIEKMKETGVIDNAMFSMFFDFSNSKSKISLGGYDLESYAVPGAQVNFHSIDEDEGKWMLAVNSVELGFFLSDNLDNEEKE